MRARFPVLRRLLASPAFAVFAVASLALGIGATTAIYAVADAVLFRPLAIADLDEVVNIYHHDPARVTAGHQIALSWPDALDIRRGATVFSDVLFWSRFNAPLTGRGTFTPVIGELVSGNYFAFIGAEPLIGRTLQPADDGPGALPVVVVGESFWRHVLGGDPDVVGQTITLGLLRVQVVGIMPARVRGVDMPNVMPTSAWLPIAQAEALGILREPGARHDREERWVLMKGRLVDGRSVDEARLEVAAIGRSLDQAVPIGSAERRAANRPEDVRAFAVSRAADLHMHESVDRVAVPTGQAVLVAVGLVLLVACTNLANLQLARGAARQRDVVVRRALGATPMQAAAGLAADSLALSLAGGLAGLVVATGLIGLMAGRLSIGSGVTLTVEPELTWRVGAAALAATAAAALVFGLIPAWHLSRAGLRTLLDAHGGGAVERWRGRRLLITAQVAVSIALLVPGALLLRQAIGKIAHDPGFNLDRLAAVQVNHQAVDRLVAATAPATPEREAIRLDEMTRAVAALRRTPGIASASLLNRLPILFSTTVAAARIDDAPQAPGERRQTPSLADLQRVVYVTMGDESVFDTLGVTLLSGRPFTRPEVESRAPVVVVSRTAAHTVFASDAIVGRTVFVGADPVTIVGVAADTDWASIGRRTYASIYRPGTPAMSAPFVIAARAAGEPRASLDAIRTVLRDLDPELPIADAVTGPDIRARQTLFDRLGARLMTLFGGVALLLALTGLTGLLTCIVTSRRRELGVRMALGADRRRIVRLVLVDGLRPVVIGGTLGLLAGAGLASLLGSSFYRLTGIDWIGLAAVTVLLIPAAAVACYLPARRAAALEPAQTLRDG
ncbi:MAG TPA: ABC transporter permease [Vicinamibacterales bacterium]|nr:ABC transporter permease [Vicinamibacterales bacterium]